MKPERLERPIFIGILLLAAYLRLNHLGWTEYKLDEANLSRLSLNLVRGVEFPMTGIGSSVGIVNLPLAAWTLAIPYALSPDPIVATGFVALLNVIAVAGCYALARRWLGSTTQNVSYIPAMVAALLFAVAPWGVIHSRKIWAQNLLPPFVIAWAWTGWLAFAQRRPRALIGHALALAACIQLHYSALWLIPVSLLWAIAFARRVRWRTALAAIGIFAATFAPFLIADVARGGESINRLVAIAGQTAAVDDQALHLSWLMITGQEIHSLAGPQQFQNYLASVPGGEAGFTLDTGIGLLALAGGFVALLDVARAARRRSFDDRSTTAFMLATWLIVPVLLQSRHSLPIFLHYFIILYPVPFVLVGWIAGRWAGRQAVRWALVAFVVVVAGLQSIQSIALQQFVASRATPGGFGVPVERLMQVASEAVRVNQKSNAGGVLIYAEGDNPFMKEGPAVFDVLLPPNVPRRFVDMTQAVEVYPIDPSAFVFYAPGGLPPALAEYASLTRAEATIPLRAGEEPAQVRAWPGQSAGTIPCSGTPLARWENGVALLAVQPSGEWSGSGGWIEVCYRVDAEPRGADYHWFNHIIGPDGGRWAQIDASGYPARSWRAGDVIRVRFGPFRLPTDAPAGRYTLRIGVYKYPDVVNVNVIDGAGVPIGDGVSIDLGEWVR